MWRLGCVGVSLCLAHQSDTFSFAYELWQCEVANRRDGSIVDRLGVGSPQRELLLLESRIVGEGIASGYASFERVCD